MLFKFLALNTCCTPQYYITLHFHPIVVSSPPQFKERGQGIIVFWVHVSDDFPFLSLFESSVVNIPHGGEVTHHYSIVTHSKQTQDFAYCRFKTFDCNVRVMGLSSAFNTSFNVLKVRSVIPEKYTKNKRKCF